MKLIVMQVSGERIHPPGSVNSSFQQQIFIELQFLFPFCGRNYHGLERLNNLPKFTELTNGKFKFWISAK